MDETMGCCVLALQVELRPFMVPVRSPETEKRDSRRGVVVCPFRGVYNGQKPVSIWRGKYTNQDVNSVADVRASAEPAPSGLSPNKNKQIWWRGAAASRHVLSLSLAHPHNTMTLSSSSLLPRYSMS